MACGAHGEGRVVRQSLCQRGALFPVWHKEPRLFGCLHVLAIGINSPYTHASASFKRTVYAPGSKEGLTMQFPRRHAAFASVSQSFPALPDSPISYSRDFDFSTRFSRFQRLNVYSPKESTRKSALNLWKFSNFHFVPVYICVRHFQVESDV